MKGLAELVLSLCDLAEAEGRLLRENVYGIAKRCFILGLALFFIGAALCCGVMASYAGMLLVMPQPAALAVAGCLCAVIGGTLGWSARKKCYPEMEKTTRQTRTTQAPMEANTDSTKEKP